MEKFTRLFLHLRPRPVLMPPSALTSTASRARPPLPLTLATPRLPSPVVDVADDQGSEEDSVVVILSSSSSAAGSPCQLSVSPPAIRRRVRSAPVRAAAGRWKDGNTSAMAVPVADVSSSSSASASDSVVAASVRSSTPVYAGKGRGAWEYEECLTLHDAVSAGDPAVLLRMLRKAPLLETYNDAGHTPLMVAAMRGDVGAVRMLLEHGALADAHARHSTETPAILVCWRGGVRMMVCVCVLCPLVSLSLSFSLSSLHRST